MFISLISTTSLLNHTIFIVWFLEIEFFWRQKRVLNLLKVKLSIQNLKIIIIIYSPASYNVGFIFYNHTVLVGYLVILNKVTWIEHIETIIEIFWIKKCLYVGKVNLVTNFLNSHQSGVSLEKNAASPTLNEWRCLHFSSNIFTYSVEQNSWNVFS